jgi:hypothetical protein
MTRCVKPVNHVDRPLSQPVDSSLRSWISLRSSVKLISSQERFLQSVDCYHGFSCVGHRWSVSLHQLTVSFVGSFRTMRHIDVIVRNGTETANSMNDMFGYELVPKKVVLDDGTLYVSFICGSQSGIWNFYPGNAYLSLRSKSQHPQINVFLHVQGAFLPITSRVRKDLIFAITND